MTGTVTKGEREGDSRRRRYDSSRRKQQAAETRAAVVQAATAMFGERGWSGTGMRDIARDAGVSVETVYANFGSKSELLRRVLDIAIVGDDRPIPLAERPEFTALAEGTLAERAAAAARLVTTEHGRTAGLHRAFRQGAASDAELAVRYGENNESRRRSVHQGAELVAGRSVGRTERDGIWAVLGSEVYELLVEDSGWSPRQYQNWLADSLVRLLAP